MTLGQEITFDYAGLLCLILVFSSFFQRLRSNRKKLVDSLTLLFFAASVFFTPLYKLWHFLSMPYGFPTRFSFVIVFWLIAAAADAWDTRDKKSLACGALVVLLLLVANGTMTLPAKLIAAGFIAGITVLLCLGFQKALAVTVAAELTFAGAATFISLDRITSMTAMPRPRRCWTIKMKCGPPWQALRLSRATGLKIGRRAIKTKGWAITTQASRITRRPTIRRSAIS